MSWPRNRDESRCSCAGCSYCEGERHEGDGFCTDCHKAAIRDAKADQAREDERRNGR